MGQSYAEQARPAAKAAVGSQFLTTRESAEYLGVPVRMIQRLRSERRVAAYRLGRHLRFKVSDLDGWAEANRDEAAHDTAAGR